MASLKFSICDSLVFQNIHHNQIFNITNTHVKKLPCKKKANFGTSYCYIDIVKIACSITISNGACSINNKKNNFILSACKKIKYY